ncbi:MAG: aminoacyl-tRNA hydrolase [Alphaproteobacteria bacterium]|nr:aminoacyl-tRNA hydrolase [Alphaproteobacteria bacterium]MBL0718216.1 aminoacyl-tRNA hydrolase [Alphaproteobacteria bacterium]
MANEESVLIIGLGNYGRKFTKNRHNVGFIALDFLAEHFNIDWKINSSYAVAKFENIYFLKPLTGMNLSGIPVINFLKKNRSTFSIDKIITVSDDLETKPMIAKLKSRISPKGHNGLRSLDSHLSNFFKIDINKLNYTQYRIGIGHPQKHQLEIDGNIPVHSFVLGNLSLEEIEFIKESVLRDLIDNS